MRAKKKIVIEHLCNDMDRYLNAMEERKKPVKEIVLARDQYNAYVESNMGVPEYRGLPLRYQ